MEAKASAKYLRGSAQKARLVIDMVRGKSVNQALATLQFTHKRAADLIEACVRSAIANATEAAEKANIAVDPDDLWIKEAFVDQGPTKSRFRTRPAPQGRAFRERRHFCHVTIKVSSDEKPPGKNGKDAKYDKSLAKPRRERAEVVKAEPKKADDANVVDANAVAPAVIETSNDNVTATTDAVTTPPNVETTETKTNE